MSRQSVEGLKRKPENESNFQSEGSSIDDQEIRPAQKARLDSTEPTPPLQTATSSRAGFIKPSESVVSTTRYDRSKHEEYVEYRLKSSSDRAPSPFNDTEGDHRTAIGFIKEGFLSLLQDLRLDTKDGVDSLKNEKRNQIYDYISAVAAMDTGERRQKLYEGINNALEDYNVVRLGKKQIDSLDAPDNKINPKILQKLREINAVQTLDSLSEIYRVFMTFSNQMPNSFVKIPGREATTDEGPRVSKANTFFANDLANPEKDNEAIFSTAIEKLSDTFFYLEIPNDLLTKHRDNTLNKPSQGKPAKLKDIFNKDGVREFYVRNNDPESLTSAISHHLNITFVRYPELAQRFIPPEHDVVDKFVDRVIGGTHKVRGQETPIQGWPTIAQNSELVSEIKEGVRQQLRILHTSLFDNSEQPHNQSKKGSLHYTSNHGYEIVCSSRGTSDAGSLGKANSNEDLKGLQSDLNDKLSPHNFEPEELISALKNEFEGHGMSESDRKAFEKLSSSLDKRRNIEEGNKELQKDEVVNILSQFRANQEHLTEISSEELLESLNEMFENELGIKHPMDLNIESENYTHTIENSIAQILESDSTTITKNELAFTLKSHCRQFIENKESEGFVAKLGITGEVKSKSFTEKMQSRNRSESPEL